MRVSCADARNETADATHLAEFHQVEGVVADYDITLGHLIGERFGFAEPPLSSRQAS